MKKSLAHLPKEKKIEIKTIVGYLLEEIQEIEAIILYGSYARGDYVDYDQRVEYDVRTYFMSDYDILILLSPHMKSYTIQQKLIWVSEKFYRSQHWGLVTPVQFLAMTIKEFNKAIEEGKYFYTDIKKEGILLYKKCDTKLARIRKLDFESIHKLAQLYYQEKLEAADEFLETTKFSYSREKYKMASFQLHQATENYLYGITLTHTLYSPKEHNLTKLFAATKAISERPHQIFNMKSNEEKRLFKLLESAYIQARYNHSFIVTKEDIDALVPKVEQLRNIMIELCEKKIEEYGKKVKKIDIYFDSFQISV